MKGRWRHNSDCMMMNQLISTAYQGLRTSYGNDIGIVAEYGEDVFQVEKEDNQQRMLLVGGQQSSSYGEGDDDVQGLDILSNSNDKHFSLGTISLYLIMVHSGSLVTLLTGIFKRVTKVDK
jgi:hypothetical protein